MSGTSSDEGSDSEAVNLTGFIFGNIDMKTGQLEDDILDPESKRQLGALSKLGLGGIVSSIVTSEEPNLSKNHRKKKSKRISYDSESEDDIDDDYDDDRHGYYEEFNVNKQDETESESSSLSFKRMKTGDAEGISSQLSSVDKRANEADCVIGKEIRSVCQTIGSPSYRRDLSKEVESNVFPDSEFGTSKDDEAIDYSDIMELADDDSIEKKADLFKDRTLMPPPQAKLDKSNADIESDTCLKIERLETPLAAMLPTKYAGVDVTDMFPDFRTGKVLRFSRLFGPGKPTSLPQVWKNVKKRRRKRKALEDHQDEDIPLEKRGWAFEFGPSDYKECIQYDSEGGYQEWLQIEGTSSIDPMKEKADRSTVTNYWRHGPAQLWYDMLDIPETEERFDYGLKCSAKKIVNEEASEASDSDKEIEQEDKNSYSEECFNLVTQTDWESSVMWDNNEKYRKLNKNKSKVTGWVPSGINRNFGPSGKSSPSNPSGKSSLVSSQGSPMTPVTTKIPKPDGGGGDDTWYSIFPVETAELVHCKWEDEIIWDVDEMPKVPEPKPLVLDPNDENIVLCVPDDVDLNASQGNIAPVKVKIPHPHVKKSKILLGKAGVINVIEEDSPPPSPKNDDKDPYNISNDEYYQPKHTEQSMLKISASGNIIQHSTPVVELLSPFIPTFMNEVALRTFHRPSLRIPKMFSMFGPLPILPLTKHIKKKAKQREEERLAAGGGDIFFMRSPDDLSGKDGELILIEYCEEHPPLLSQVGMCSKIKNYYKRKTGKDVGPPEVRFGETTYAHTSPFLGAMHPGELIQTIENNMYRVPIYQHPRPKTDFLVIRKKCYFIREFDGVFTAGQECPLFEVPGPNSKRANNFVRDFLQVFIYRLFWKSRDTPRRIKMEEIKKAFPMHSESSIRKRLKQCADFKRTGQDSNWWVIKPDFRLPTEEEIRAMVSPEQCCAYFSLIAAEQRLKDAGYGEKSLFATQDDDDEENQGKIDDEVKTAPWNTTRAYIQAMKGKCLLQLTGPADPTGCGEGFSYVRVPNKPQTNKEEQEAQPKRIVTGTDADLRRLSLNDAKALLRKFDVPEEEIKKLSRWEVIDVVRTLSTEKAKAGEMGMNKFSRGNRFSVAEHQERYKEECQRIFELQNRVLSSTEVLSTDEEESSDDELSDIEEMGKNIENMLSNKKTSCQLEDEKEEQERRDLHKMIMGDGPKEDERSSKKRKKDEEDTNNLYGLTNHPGRVLQIHRTFKKDNKNYTRTEIVRKPAIIDIYMRIRTMKDENFIRQFALLDDQAKEKMKKEKRRLQEQLRRIKRNQEKDFQRPSSYKKKKVKVKPDLKMKCGACGQVGHMKTNKTCPNYRAPTPPLPALQVAMTEEQEEEIEKELYVDDEELVKVDGTKVQLSGKLIKRAEEMKRRSLLLKVPKDAVGYKRKRSPQKHHCDYLSRKEKTANRQRIDPVVKLGGLFEEILNDIKGFKEMAHFVYPVSSKDYPNYHKVVDAPMDLQTIRERNRENKYQTRGEFLQDIELIAKNSVKFNGPNHALSVSASKIVEICKRKLEEKQDEVGKLERMINPLLDDNDQTGFAYILDTCVSKIKGLKDAYPFLHPVDKKKVPNYYEVIRNPMDLETIHRNVKSHKYRSCEELLADIDLIHKNSLQYNGQDSTFSKQAGVLVPSAKSFLDEFKRELVLLEANIKKSREASQSISTASSEMELDGVYMDNEDDFEEVDEYDPVKELNPSVSEGELDNTLTQSDLEEDHQLTAVEAMMMMSSGSTDSSKRKGRVNNPPSRHGSADYLQADLEISDSDNEETETSQESNSFVPGSLWF